MTTRVYANKGIVDFTQFKRVERGNWTYWSEFNQRQYELKLEAKSEGGYHWRCDCPDARKISHPHGKQCKHEIALTQLLKSRYEQKCMAEIQAEQIIEEIQAVKAQREIVSLRAEIEALRAELAETRAIQTPDLAEIKVELSALRKENEEIKKALATKATARKKHQLEIESAQIKEQINTALDDAVENAQAAIRAAEMARAELADLEAIPYALKAELDSWTEAGKEELQPDYQAPESEPEIRKELRDVQESERKRRTATPEERRKMAPLNGNQVFSLLKQ